MLVSLLKRSWRPILLVAIVEAGIGGFYFAGTELIPRDRPPVKLLDAGLVPDASYPSGHVATSLVCWAGAVVLVWTYFRAARWVALLLLLLPLGTLVSRLYLGAHHLTDALTSVVYASVWLLVVAGVLLPEVSTSATRSRNLSTNGGLDSSGGVWSSSSTSRPGAGPWSATPTCSAATPTSLRTSRRRRWSRPTGAGPG